MNHMDQMTSIPWAAQDELYAELSKVSNVAALSPQERAVYDENLRQYRDNLAMIAAAHQDGKEEGLKEGKEEGLKEGKEEGLKEGKEEGLKEGKEEGLKEGRLEEKRALACKMLADNYSPSMIAKYTGLSHDEIEKLTPPMEGNSYVSV